MKQKVTKKRASVNKRINARAIGIWTRRMAGMQVQEIATELGINDSTVWRNLHAVEQSGVIEDKIGLELKKHEELWGLALACVIANIKSGELRAAEDIFKYTGVWTDKLEVTGKVKPDEQQKKFMANMEALLKLSKDQVQGALPEGIEAMEKTKETETQSQLENKDSGVPEHIQKIPGVVVEKTVEHHFTGEAIRFEKGCTCADPISRDPKCPVHGGKEGGHPPPPPVEG